VDLSGVQAALARVGCRVLSKSVATATRFCYDLLPVDTRKSFEPYAEVLFRHHGVNIDDSVDSGAAASHLPLVSRLSADAGHVIGIIAATLLHEASREGGVLHDRGDRAHWFRQLTPLGSSTIHASACRRNVVESMAVAFALSHGRTSDSGLGQAFESRRPSARPSVTGPLTATPRAEAAAEKPDNAIVAAAKHAHEDPPDPWLTLDDRFV
jgi:hypothetical protein